MAHNNFTNATINQYRIIKLIGSGAYGLVFLVENTLDNQLYAMKAIAKRFDKHSEKQSDYLIKQLNANFGSLRKLNRLNLSKLAEPSTSTQNSHPFIKEISLHLQVHDHPNVITIHEILDSFLAVFVIMDYYKEGDLFTNIVDKSIYVNSKPSLIKRVFSQLIDVISYCHSKGIYHCDIKPENIMCDSNGEKLLIGDFGLSTTEKFMNSHKCIGSSYYMPPERLITMELQEQSKENELEIKRGKKVNAGQFTCLDEDKCYPSNMGDLWSLSIILINLTCMRNPWNKACSKVDRTYKVFKTKPKVLKDILPLSDELFDILIKCLKENPYERISLYELRDLVQNCKTFTTEGPLSEEEQEQVEIELPDHDSEEELMYVTSSSDDAFSLNSYDHHKDYIYENDYDINGFQKDSDSIFQNNINILNSTFNKDLTTNKQQTTTVARVATVNNKNIENFELHDNYSTIANASFNINFDLQQDMIHFFKD